MYPRPYQKYVLLERLGLGGMSEVDLAKQSVEGSDYVRFVVIKRIKTDRHGDDAFVRMFKDEARITSELHHNNIGQVYEFGRVGDEYFLALEYVPGIDARGIINTLRDRGQRVPVRVALRILCDVLDALYYAHNKVDTYGKPMNIVHRDVNPRNIMVSIRGETKLIDFGVAKASGRLERTKTDHVKGKFSYMAPEQILGQDIDARADIFAVGLTLFEFVAGYGPFYGLNQVQIVHKLMSGKIPPLPDVKELQNGTELERIYRKATAPEVKERYQDARAFRRDLERLADEMGGLPTNEQMAEFLSKVDAKLEQRISDKMETFSGPIPVNHDATTANLARPPEELMVDDAIPDVDEGSLSGTGITRTAIAGVLGLSATAGMVVLALVLTGVGIGIWYMNSQGAGTVVPGTELEPATETPGDRDDDAEASTGPMAPGPKPRWARETGSKATEAEAAGEGDAEGAEADPAGEAASAPKAQPVVSPKPSPSTPAPEAEAPAAAATPEDAAGEPEGQGAADGSEEGEPAATEAGSEAPEVEAPPPEPVATGYLNVTSEPRGRKVFVDGALVGVTPIRRMSIPVGEHIIQVEGFDILQKKTIKARMSEAVTFQ